MPYSSDPLEPHRDFGNLWMQLLMPSEELPEELPVYVDNIARTIIDQMVGDILPTGSRLIYEGLDENAGKKDSDTDDASEGDQTDPRVAELNRRLFNFGPDFVPGIGGFFEWLDLQMTDCAQSGDGLLIPAFVPGVGSASGRIRWHYYPYELWDQEKADAGDDVEFYRVEYKYIGANGNHWWRRFDILREEIRRYSDKEIPDLAAINRQLYDIDPIYMDGSLAGTGFFSPPMSINNEASESLAGMLEKLTLRGLGDWLPTVIRWRRSAIDDYRGDPELTSSELSAADDINRLLTRWKDAAVGAGEPAQFSIDLSLPTDEGTQGGDPMLKTVRPGDFIQAQSTGDQQGRVMFPENTPTQFPHGAVLDYFRQAVLGDTPNMGLDPTKISRFGELTGFAAKTLRGSYDKRINKHRLKLLTNGVLHALKKGIQLLALKGQLPDGLDGAQIEPKIEFAAPEYNPDEMLKLVTVVQMLRTMRAPVADQVALLPYKPVNAQETKDALQQSMEDMDLLQEMQQSLQQANQAGAGLDNRAKQGAGRRAKPQGGGAQRPAAP